MIAPQLDSGCVPNRPVCNVNSSVQLASAATADVPIAVATVPPVVSSCQSSLRLGAASSTSTSVFPLSYEWQLDPTSPNAATLNPWLRAASVTAPHATSISVPLSLLLGDAAPGASFSFLLRVTTYLGVSSAAVRATTTVVANAPTVGIAAPSEVVRSSLFTLISQLEPGCTSSVVDDEFDLAWQWSVLSADNVTVTPASLEFDGTNPIFSVTAGDGG